MKRFIPVLFLAFLAVLFCAHSTAAIPITLNSYNVVNWPYGGSTATLKIFANQDFLTSDGVLIKAGNASNGTGWYRSVTCSIVGTTITIPAITSFPTTSDSLTVPTATFTARFYTGATAREYFQINFQVKHTFSTPQTWDTVVIYNNPQGQPPDRTYPTFDQVAQIVNSSSTTAVPQSRTLSATSPVRIEGIGSADLSGNRTLSCPTCVVTTDSRLSDTRTPTDGSVTNAKVASGAAVALNKLAATTAGRALQSDGSGEISPSSVTSIELGYLSGVGSPIQTQLNGKQATLGFTAENTASKDAASGYAGLTAGSLLKTAEMPAFTGDATSSPGAVNLTLATITSPAGPTGDATHVPVVTIDAKGRVTALTSTTITGGGLGTVLDVTQAPYSARADAVKSADGAITSGTNDFTSGSKSCVAGDNGKAIVVAQAGALSATSGLNNALRTTITGCSGTHFLLAANASNTVSGKSWVYGTINTTAIQSANTALGTIGGTLFFPAGSYMVGAVTLSSSVTVAASPRTTMLYSIANSVFTFDNKSNITVDGIDIDAAGNPLGNGAITLIGGTGVSNILIQNNFATDTFLTNNVAPVATFNRHFVLLRDYNTNVRVINNTGIHALRYKFAGGTVGESNGFFKGNWAIDTNENGFSILTGQAVTVRDLTFEDNHVVGIMATGNGFVMGDDGGGGVTQAFLSITYRNNSCVGLFPSNTACFQDRGTGIERDLTIDGLKCDNRAGTTESTTMCINKANQGTTGQSVNFQARGIVADGVFDYAAVRIGDVASGVIDGTQVTMTGAAGQRCLRIGNLTNVTISNSRLNNCGLGLVFNAGTYSNVNVNDTSISLFAGNNVEGVYIDTQTSPIDLRIDKLNVYGAGGSFTNVYGIEDAENAGGDTDTVQYTNLRFSNINTTSGLGSRYYQTLATHAVVTEVPAPTIPTFTDGAMAPSVRGMTSVFASDTGATTTTNFANGYTGQKLTMLCTTTNRVLQNGSNFALAGAADFTCTANDSITLIYNGTKWIENNRSVN